MIWFRCAAPAVPLPLFATTPFFLYNDTMKTFQLSLVSLLPVSTCFYLEPLRHTSRARASIDDFQNEGKISYPKFDYPAKEPDMERAKECAEHFGKCSVAELKELREGLHKKRIQEIVFGDVTSATTTAPKEIFQERLLEEELSLQLSLLHDEMPPSYLFATEPFEETDDDGQIIADGMAVAAKVKKAEQNHVLEELVEEGALDSLAICALIGVMLIAPQFIMQ